MNRHFALTALLSLTLLVPVPAVSAAIPTNDDLDFAMEDLAGLTHRLSAYRGRWVVLNFWATWCPPCVEEIPELAAFHAANPGRVMLGIDYEDNISSAELHTFIKEHGINYPVLPIADHTLPGLEPIHGLPTTIIISPAGELLAKHTGPLTQQMLEDFIRQESSTAGSSDDNPTH